MSAPHCTELESPLSEDLHVLMDHANSNTKHFDVIIIGSGYGGAIAASELAGAKKPDGKPLNICVLERGKQYLPGMFPAKMAELAGHVRYASQTDDKPHGVREGLFDIRLGDDVCTLLASGLGGGSLINAGVLEEPDPSVFDQPNWPQAVRSEFGSQGGTHEAPDRLIGHFSPNFEATAKLLGAQFTNNDTRDKNEKCITLKKRQRHAELGGAQFRGAQIISVLNKDGYTTKGGIQLDPCNNCGDCMTGCNHSAKISLDTSLLAKAKRSALKNVKLVTGATVLRLERDNDCWSLKVVHTAEHPRQHQGDPYKLTANKVILSAGSLGSTEILLRSEKKGELQFSSKLGQQFSTNGDNVLAIYNLSDEVNAVADDAIEPFSRRVGPTITGIIDTRISGNTGGLGTRFLAEEFSIPGPLRRIFEEIFTTANSLRDLGETDKTEHRPGTSDDLDPFAVNRNHIARTSLIGINGHDSADGVLKLKSLKNGDGITDELGDGLIEIKWKKLKHSPIFDGQIKQMNYLLDQLDIQKRESARIIPNPLWHPLPEKLTNILDSAKGPLLTVHPLGGCPMGEDITIGVVDAYGRVFDGNINASQASWFGSLVVLDGAIIPTSIGVNPSLSIATLARWAVTHLRDKEWAYRVAAPSNLAPSRLPQYRQPTYQAAKDTKVEMLERLSGMADIGGQRKRIEITLKFQSVSLLSLMQNIDRRIDLNIDSRHPNTLRIYTDELAWQDAYNHRVSDEVLEKVNGCTTIEITGGHIQVLNRGPKNDRAITRIQRTIWPWWCNRGKRDTWQTIREHLSYLAALFRPVIMGGLDFSVLYLAHSTDLDELAFRKKTLLWLLKKLPVRDKNKFEALIEGLISTASHAGEQRTILYELQAIQNNVTTVIKGKKLLTYGYASNPIHQLSELELTEFMGHPIIKRNNKLTEPENLFIPGNCLFGYIIGIVIYLIFTKPLNYLSNLFREPLYTEEESDDWILKLDTRYLAKKRLPLIRITEMQDMPSAMMDFISFGNYMARLMVSIHLWTYRKPDAYPEKKRSTTKQLLAKVFNPNVPDAIGIRNLNTDSGDSPRANLLPARLPGLKDPEIIELTVKPSLEGHESTKIRLTNYKKNAHSSGDRTPIVMIHGYSASGTTFAHAAIPLDITRFLSQGNQERDIWILDLRTSSAMNTATKPWQMEEVGCNDIPVAIAHVLQMTGQQQVDVITHCVGSAMFSMAVLIAPKVGDANYTERNELPKSIRSVVLSQYGPVVAVTPDNAARAFAIDHLRHFVNDTAYQFQGDVEGTNGILDRLLSALYYPRTEFFIENPQDTPGQDGYLKNTAWTKTRHRMDALYGRTFNLANMDEKTLASIDDFFGKMNLDTLAQMIPFSRTRRVTGRQGDNLLDLPNSMPMRWLFPTLSLHGAQNGMIDIATKTLMEGLFKGFANKGYQAIAFPHLGHQDSFIGTKTATAPLFQAIRDFHNNLPTHGVSGQAVQHAEQPWLGPIVETITNTNAGQLLPFCVAPSPTLPRPDRLIVLCGATINDNVWDAPTTITLNDNVWDAPTTITLLDLPIQKNSVVNGWIRAEIDLSQLAPTKADSPKFAHVLFIYTLPEWMTEKTDAELSADRRDLPPSNLTLVQRLYQRKNSQEFDKTKIALRQPDTATFALGSCQYSAGLTTEIPASGSYNRLALIFEPEKNKELPTPVFLLLIGDQIYIDETAGVFSPKTREDQDAKKYEALYQNREVRKVLRNIPSYRMLDDHEIEDNYEPDSAQTVVTARGKESQERKKLGIENYWKYQRMATPNVPASTPLYFAMTRQLGEFSCPFFICDTRSERDCRYPAERCASIMSKTQMRALGAWLKHHKKNINPKFIASPSMFLPRQIESKSNNPRAVDAWDGYPQSLHWLLQLIYDLDIKNLIFLSGDAHLSCTAKVTIKKENEERITTVHSIHSSGLYTPYPFANALWEDYLAVDKFSFLGRNGQNYHCAVTATQSTSKGDGFALISLLSKEDGATELEVEFNLAGGSSFECFTL